MCLPFDDLAERRLEKGERFGFEYEIVHNGMGYRCGYIRVLPGHPWFEMPYEEIPVGVHGGLTFGKHGTACPTHGEKDEWWIGFDCAHAGDAVDLDLPFEEALKELYRKREFRALGQYGEVRTTEYVRKECEELCIKAAAVVPAPVKTET